MHPMPELSFWETLRIATQQPEYLHVLFHGVPLYGLGFGVLMLALGWALRNRRAEVLALVLVFISAASAWPVARWGDQAYDNVSTLRDMDGEGVDWLDEHMERAEKMLPFFYSVAGISLAALLLPIWWPRTRRPLYALTLLGTLGASAAIGWVAAAGGKVRHREFRYSAPPVRAEEAGE